MADRLMSLIDELTKERDRLYEEAGTIGEAIDLLQLMHDEREMRARRSDELKERVKDWLK
jgi:hypothetical protein